MATSSITKEYIIKDEKAYNKLIQEINSVSNNIEEDKECLSVQKGKELLKQFSFDEKTKD